MAMRMPVWPELDRVWSGFSLRWRLLIFYVVTLVVLFSAYFVFVSYSAEQALTTSAARRLQNEAVALAINERDRSAEQDQTNTQDEKTPQDIKADNDMVQEVFNEFAAERDLPGVLLDVHLITATNVLTSHATGEGEQPPPPNLAWDRKALQQGAVSYITEVNDTRHLVYVFALSLDNKPVAVVQLSTSLRDIDNFLAFQQLILLIGLLLALLVGLLLGIPLVTAALRPLHHMAEASQEIAAGDLSQRLAPVPYNDEIGRLTETFNSMMDWLEASFEQQRQFISDASHEMRTPLAAIRGTLDVMLMGADESDPDLRQRLLSMTQQETTRLARLVENLLTLSRFDANQNIAHPQPIEPGPIVSDVVEHARILAADRSITWNAPEECAILADGDRFRQLVWILVDNAIKHTPTGAAITVTLDRQPGAVRFSVADRGPGIAPADLRRIFDRFYRGDTSRASHTGGSGLGLAIASAICQAHGIELHVASPPGAGATFWADFPSAPATAGTPPGSSVPVGV